jgi:hypothetical protein
MQLQGTNPRGATISSKVMIHIRESFARGLVYVMLFRIRSQIFLTLIHTTYVAMVFRKCEHYYKLRY